MMTDTIFRLDRKKALETLLYVLRKKQNLYTALKLLYFADRIHLQRYGRLIYGETYCAMKSGPVPSFAYDIIKAARGDGHIDCQLPIEQSIRVEGNSVAPLRMPELDFLSESDLECLDETIEEYGSLPPGELKKRSHDKAYNSATENDSIPLASIINSLDNAAEIKQYLYG